MAFKALKTAVPEFRITSQVELELLYSKHQVMPMIKGEFIESGAAGLLKEKGIPEGFGLDLLVQMSLHKRAGVPVLVGLLKKHFQAEENPEQATADMLLKAAEADLVNVNEIIREDEITGQRSKSHEFVVIYDITDDVQAALDQFQYPLPMVEEPVMVTSNSQTGYQTIKGSIILKNNHHDDDVCLDHINRMNQTPLRINADIVAFVQNKWKDLDKQRPDETWMDFKKRKDAFRKYDQTSRDVLNALLAQGNRFWLTHKVDKRGRTYCQGYHVSYQSNDWAKAIIEFADGEVLNDR